MKKFVQGAALPFTLFASVLLILGCDSTAQNVAEKDSSESQTVSVAKEQSDSEQELAKPEVELKTGNFFYIARDIADVQLKAGDYIAQLQQSQESLQQALETKDVRQLETTTHALKTQLTGFNTALDQLNLKSAEINDIRQNIMIANAQALKSPLMNGEVDFSQVDFKKIEQQLGSVQSEMLKLAAMLIPTSNNESDSKS